jgi:DNA-binding XRE family transcriptional regulator
MTSGEINKALAKKIQLIRKKHFKSQTLFATHINMSLGTYARFEKTGQVSLKGFIDILKGIERVDEIANLFKEEKEDIQW